MRLRFFFQLPHREQNWIRVDIRFFGCDDCKMQVVGIAVARVPNVADYIARAHAIPFRKEIRHADHVVIMVLIPEFIQHNNIVARKLARSDADDEAVRAGKDWLVRSGADVCAGVLTRVPGARAIPTVLDAAAGQWIGKGGKIRFRQRFVHIFFLTAGIIVNGVEVCIQGRKALRRNLAR